ncbi:M20/M25/M40 family metallo-hydrolase, partial [Nonlabens mediterrranea]|nr:M20/M25/M40 family metallo-hydrolase [Nonlabens mediterrranea]
LNGGHSGMDIIKGLGNANKMMTRLLDAMQKVGHVHIESIHGGSLRNAIPREANTIISFMKTDEIMDQFNRCKAAIHDEYKSLETKLDISLTDTTASKLVLSASESRNLVFTLLGIHNGVYRMSPDISDLVETSNNLARVTLEEGYLQIACLTRSSVDSSKTDLASSISAVMKLAEMKVTLSGDYPGWQPNTNSAILEIAKAKYETLFDHEPRVVACHAGLECGILGERYPGLDMISFGPNIRGAHSPDEHVEIPSVQKFWKYLLDILKDIPKA